MKVIFKKFDVEMELKNKGIELDVCDTAGKHIGDLVVTKTKLIWCPGKTQPKNGKTITWDKFIELMQSQ